MPKQSRIKKNKRSEVRQQDVFEFGPKIEPAARPVNYNTSVRAQDTSGGAAQALLEGLGLAGDVLKEYGKYADKRDKAHKEEGKLAAARGDQLNADATEAFIEGYEEMAGAGEGYLELQAVLNQHANENAGATLEEFATTQDAAIKQFFNGRSDSFTKGALPGAISLQREHQRDFIQAKQAEFEADKLAKSRALNDANITQIIKGEPKNLSKDIRMELNHRQVSGKQMGLSKMQISGQFVNLMAERAFDNADPNMMQFAYEKGPDGIRLIDNPKLAPKIRQAEKDAKAEYTRRLNAIDKEREEALKDAKVAVNVKTVEVIDAAGNPELTEADRMKLVKGAYDLINKAEDAGMMTRAESEHHRDELGAIYGPDGLFAERDNVDRKIQALTLAQGNPEALTPEYLAALKKDITRESYEEIYKAAASTRQRRQTQSHKESPAEKHFKEQKKVYQDIVNRKNPFTNHAMFDRGDQREAAFNTALVKRMAVWQKQNQGKFPNEDETKEIMDQASEDALKAVPQSLTPSGKAPKSVLEAGNGTFPGPKTEPQEERVKNLNSALDGLLPPTSTAKETAEEQGD
jgi:hypothetical protein